MVCQYQYQAVDAMMADLSAIERGRLTSTAARQTFPVREGINGLGPSGPGPITLVGPRGCSTRMAGAVQYLGIDEPSQASVWYLLGDDGEIRARGQVETTVPALGRR
jgi:hypothetical protein